MDAHRYQSSYNGVIFNRVYDDTGITDDESHLVEAFRESDYRLETLDATRVTVEDFRELRQFLEGTEPNEAYEGALILTGRGVIHGGGATPAIARADLEDKDAAMRAAFSPALVRHASRLLDPAGSLPYDFKVTTGGGISARRAYARPSIGRPVLIGRAKEGLSRRFLFQLISFEPCFVGQTLNQVVVALGGGNVTNAGSYFAKPKIRIAFSGAGNAALTINNTTTGQSIVINATTAAGGEAWILDVRTGRIYRESDSASRYSQRVSGYVSGLHLQPGVNAFTFANTGGVSQVRVDTRDAWA